MLLKEIVVHLEVIYQSDIFRISFEICQVVLEKKKVCVIQRHGTADKV